MPIANIVDRRTNNHNVEIDAVFEPSCHDNNVKGATQFTKIGHKIDFVVDWRYAITIAEAIDLMKDKDFPVTLYAYDKGTEPCGPG